MLKKTYSAYHDRYVSCNKKTLYALNSYQDKYVYIVFDNRLVSMILEILPLERLGTVYPIYAWTGFIVFFLSWQTSLSSWIKKVADSYCSPLIYTDLWYIEAAKIAPQITCSYSKISCESQNIWWYFN